MAHPLVVLLGMKSTVTCFCFIVFLVFLNLVLCFDGAGCVFLMEKVRRFLFAMLFMGCYVMLYGTGKGSNLFPIWLVQA